MKDVDFPEGALKDSTIITPIGICLTYYEQYNNFIYITFNGNRIKLYDNNKLTVTDAAMQADFTRDGLFPRRGEELRYTVNGKNRVTKGEYGESAHVYVNGEEVNLSHNIKSNDVITLEEATLGTPAQEKIADLVDYNGKITVTVNGDEMQLPKPVKVNGTAVTEEYSIQNGDDIEVSTFYTNDGFLEFMGLSAEDMILIINGTKADSDVEIHTSDTIEIRNRKEYELKEIYKESHIELRRDAHKDSKKDVKETDKEQTESVENLKENEKAEPEKTNEATAEEIKTAETTDESAMADEKASSVEETKTEEIETVSENVSEEKESTEAAKDEEDTVKTAKVETEEVKENEQAATDVRTETILDEEPEKEEVTADTQETTIADEKKKTENHEESRQEKTHLFQNRKENVTSQKKQETAEETGKKIIVIVNQKPIVMKGKESYMFVDIFDYIDFDTSKMQGRGIATLVNGKDAQYTQELYNGDKIEVYWK